MHPSTSQMEAAFWLADSANVTEGLTCDRWCPARELEEGCRNLPLSINASCLSRPPAQCSPDCHSSCFTFLTPQKKSRIFLFRLLENSKYLFISIRHFISWLLQVMQETNTVIMWPEKLKVGSKSKRGKFCFSIAVTSSITLSAHVKMYFVITNQGWLLFLCRSSRACGRWTRRCTSRSWTRHGRPRYSCKSTVCFTFPDFYSRVEVS